MNKKLLFTIALLLSVTFSFAQKVKFKKGKVLVDGKECLIYDDSDSNNLMITNNDESQTIFLKFIRTGVGHNGGLYTKIIFADQKKSLTSKSYIFNKKNLVKKLLKSGVIKDCNFDEKKIDKFILRYDEDVESNLIRH